MPLLKELKETGLLHSPPMLQGIQGAWTGSAQRLES